MLARLSCGRIEMSRIFNTAIISLNALRACDSSRSAKSRSEDYNHLLSAYRMNSSRDSLTCPISRVAQVSGEGVRFVISLPLGTAAVVVVREDLVIVNVTTGEQRAPARTAHGSGHVRVSQLGALVSYSLQSPWHEIQRTCDGYETIILDTSNIYPLVLCTPKYVHCPHNRVGLTQYVVFCAECEYIIDAYYTKCTVFAKLYNSYLESRACHNKKYQLSNYKIKKSNH